MHRTFKLLSFIALATLLNTALVPALYPLLPISALAQTTPDLDRKAEADRLLDLGLEYVFRSHQYQEAINVWEQALTLYRELGDRVGEGSALFNIGTVHSFLGQYQQAIEFYEQDLAITRELGDKAAEGNILNNIGLAHSELGQYHQAIELHQQALEIARNFGGKAAEGRALGNLGVAYASLGQYQQAIEVREQSLVIFRALNARDDESIALGGLGGIYLELGQYQQAIEFNEQSLAIAREFGNRRIEAISMNSLGGNYASLGEYQQVIEFYERGLTIAREIGARGIEGSSLGGLGSAYLSLGQYRQGIGLVIQQLFIARETGDRREEGKALVNLSIAYWNIDQYQQALEFYGQGLDVLQAIGNRHGTGFLLNNLGAALITINQFADAEEILQQSIEVFESLRTDLPDAERITIAETQAQAYANLERALIAQGKIIEALEITERGRAQALALQLITREGNIATDLVTFPNADEIRRIAQHRSASLVEYSIMDFADDNAGPILYIWVVSPQGEITFRQKPLTDIDLSSLVTDARDAIGVRSSRVNDGTVIVEPTPEAMARQRTATNQTLTQLHDLLIEPIADLLPPDPNQPVVFIPQGELFLVPFPALKDDNGEYLIENHTILTAPSIQVLQLTHDIAKTRNASSIKNPVVVGNPAMPTVTFLNNNGDFQDVRLNPLYGAQQEAEAISDFLQAPALIGGDATEATVKQQLASADLIHLATHGLLEYGDPRETGTRDTPGAIALAPGNGEDGLLTSAEILQMDLQADLVVLSACDTGRGRITGDGVIGLSRSFIAAGVPSIIVSLWSVPDAPTANLMTEFYRQLDQGQSKAQALRQAMLITMQTHPDPKDWAAFTLIGESE